MSRYSDAVEDGYDGPSPSEERRIRHYRQRLIASPDCRDPDHPGCDQCEDFDCDVEGDECAEETCPNCGQGYHQSGYVYHDIGRCQACGDGTDEGDDE